MTATNAFLATLDATKRDQVTYDFSENKARQTWSNFPTTTVAREGIVMSDLTAKQQKAADAVLQVALSTTGAQQDANIRTPGTPSTWTAPLDVQAAYDRHRDLLGLRGHRCPTQKLLRLS
jgi:hypothetical protein